MYILHFSPCTFVSSPQKSLGGLNRADEEKGSRIPVNFLAGGEGKQGEKREGVRADLRVVLDGSGAAGRWVAGDVQGRRSWKLGSGELG